MIDVKTRKINLIDAFFIILMLLYIIIIPWYNNGRFPMYWYVLLIVYIFYLTIKYNYLKHISILGWNIIILNMFIVILNLLINGLNNHIFNSLLNSTYINLLIIIYFDILDKEKGKSLKKFISKYLFILFNLYFIINVPIMIKQLDHTYFMMHYISDNPMYEDSITGLIGDSGTHVLGFFWICLITLNLYKINRKKNILLILLTIFELAFMIIMSSYNDNTALYFLLLIILVEFHLHKLIKVNIRSLMKYIVIIISIIGLFMIAKNYNDRLQTFYENKILVKYEKYIGKSNVYGEEDEERVALYKYALEHGDGYKMGKGIGSIQSYGDPTLPRHFGMSELSLKTYEGGISYLIVITLIYIYITQSLFQINKNAVFIVALNFILFVIYTIIFRDMRLIFFLTITTLIFKYEYLEEYINNGRIKDEKK